MRKEPLFGLFMIKMEAPSFFSKSRKAHHTPGESYFYYERE